MSADTRTFQYVIEQDAGACYDATPTEERMIEEANLRWQGAEDLPYDTAFAEMRFGGVSFTFYRKECVE